ncbi:AAA family ATPase [Corynebacterium sp. zg254]|uniref:ATP-binding protein n=1 Tax=Corynebacterium zhongnanshanii TaxID=2768834 RepID=A0ABQ6VC78_9CORY|nr:MULTISPECIES: AAA family ATPase [Corynebacterium]KAB3519840.1 ATP-binding protein [Corynebacterium zhongnanshanii]MCR5914774.1 AAA family ATPase [Corynebacterium sp. zg254]
MGKYYRETTLKSDIDKLRKMPQKSIYPYYLHSLSIDRLRGLSDTEIEFRFPVTAVIGVNGSGKSTVLGAAALSSQSIKPQVFFARAGKYDDSMRGWSVEYRQNIGQNGIDNVKTSCTTYPDARWRRNKAISTRPVTYIGVTRTIPANERKNLTKFSGLKFTASHEIPLSDTVKNEVKQIISKETENYIRLSIESGNQKRRTGPREIYAVDSGSSKGTNYSQFHFGAGEASIISIVDEIERSDDYSLILIDELENGLHPVAVNRLVEYLLRVAKRKKVQIIFTTHSNDALKALPDEAVYYVTSGKLSRGKPDVETLKTLTGDVDTSLAFLVEDKAAKNFVEGMLRTYRSQYNPQKAPNLDEIEVHFVGGAQNVEQQTKSLTNSTFVKFPVVGLLDGDQSQKQEGEIRAKKFKDWNNKYNSEGSAESNPGQNAPRSYMGFLPGKYDPEQVLFQDTIQAFNNKTSDGIQTTLEKLTVMLGLTPDHIPEVRQLCERINLEIQDFHTVFERLNDELHCSGVQIVETAFVNSWCEAYPEKVRNFFKPFEDLIPMRTFAVF